MRRSRLGLVTSLLFALLAVPLAASARVAATNDRVTMTEFHFAFSPTSVRKGIVRFTLANNGSVGHDLKINGKKSATIGPNKTGSFSVTFRKAGKYPYLCTVPGHAAAGMKGVLVVK
jgi:plastocyanin